MSERKSRVLKLLSIALYVGVAACGQKSDETGNQISTAEREHMDRMSVEHRDDTPVANAATSLEPREAVGGWDVIYASIDGAPVSGYLARPTNISGPLPGLIVIHEWWGLNDNIRAMTERLAAEGYVALAVDLYVGQAAEDPARARELATAAMAARETVERNLKQAYEFLTEDQRAPAIGTIGWCFGGGWSLNTALMLPDEIDATVIYYGRLVTDPEVLEPLRMPILGIFGDEDRGIPVESAREFEAALQSLGKNATIHVYEGADHAFANPSGTRYKPEAAEDAWRKTVAFLAEYLGS